MSTENMHTSIDLETLDTTSSSHILSIGYCMFDISTGEIQNEKELIINIESDQHGRSKSISTIMWWMNQTDEARKRFTGCKNTYTLLRALQKLSDDIKHSSSTIVWGNGSMFDISILEDAYEKNSTISIPWKFYEPRDMRTIVGIASMLGFDKRSVQFIGEKHSAGDDAIHQARVISSAYQHISGLSNKVNR